MSKSFTSRSIIGRLPFVRQGLNLLMVFSLLFSALGIPAPPASAAVPEKTESSHKQAALPGLAQPEVHRTVRPAQAVPAPALDGTDTIWCTNSSYWGGGGAVTVKGCDNVARKTLHIQEIDQGLNIILPIYNPNKAVVYYSMYVKYHLVIGYIAESFYWSMGNVYSAVGGNNGYQGTGSYVYHASGQYDPTTSGDGSFGIKTDIYWLWPNNVRSIDYVDVYLSTSPLNDVPLESTLCLLCSLYAQAAAEAGEGINTSTGGDPPPVQEPSLPTFAGGFSFR